MSTDKQEKKERKILIRLTEKSANDFINHCDSNGYTISKRLRLLIEKDLEGKLQIND